MFTGIITIDKLLSLQHEKLMKLLNKVIR